MEMTRTEHDFMLATPTRRLLTGRVILTTGGQSYPGSGTTGDGFRFAAQLGHTIVTPRPALAPLTVAAVWVGLRRRVTLPDLSLRTVEGTKQLASRPGAPLFAHVGLT